MIAEFFQGFGPMVIGYSLLTWGQRPNARLSFYILYALLTYLAMLLVDHIMFHSAWPESTAYAFGGVLGFLLPNLIKWTHK
jgi:hypothetical protein